MVVSFPDVHLSSNFTCGLGTRLGYVVVSFPDVHLSSNFTCGLGTRLGYMVVSFPDVHLSSEFYMWPGNEARLRGSLIPRRSSLFEFYMWPGTRLGYVVVSFPDVHLSSNLTCGLGTRARLRGCTPTAAPSTHQRNVILGMHQLAVGSDGGHFANRSVRHRREPGLFAGRGLLARLLLVGGERGFGTVGVAGLDRVGRAWRGSRSRLERTHEGTHIQWPKKQML